MNAHRKQDAARRCLHIAGLEINGRDCVQDIFLAPDIYNLYLKEYGENT
jgi:hypothetical protein